MALSPTTARVAVPLGLVAVSAIAATLSQPLLAPLERWSVDTRVAMRPVPPAAKVIAVPVDSEALARPAGLDEQGAPRPHEGPWELVNELTPKLYNAGARAVAFEFATLRETIAVPEGMEDRTEREITRQLQIDANLRHVQQVDQNQAIVDQGANTDEAHDLLASFENTDDGLAIASPPKVLSFRVGGAPQTAARNERAFLARASLPSAAFGGVALPTVDAIAPPVDRAKRAAAFGALELVPDPDGIVRRHAPLVRYGSDVLPSLPLAAASAHLRGEAAAEVGVADGSLVIHTGTSVPLDAGGRYLIPWIDDDDLRTVIASDLLDAEDETNRAVLGDALVIVYDDRNRSIATPLGAMSSGRVHAHVTRALVAGDGMAQAPIAVAAAWITALGLGLFAAGSLLGATRLLAATLLLAAAHGAASFGLARTGVLVPFAAPLALTALAGVALLWNASRMADAERRRLDALLTGLRGATDEADLRLRLERLELEVERTPIRLGAYRLTGLIERGGMGAVFRAIDESLQRPVAVKIVADVDGEMRARFQREAELVARISHPNVVQVYGVGEHAGVPYFAMELVDGESLARRLVSGGPMEPIPALRLAAQIARGLAAAHAHGIVHRDVKPSNVLIAGGNAKIVDFGVAKAGETGLTGTGAILGTADYMSPEQAQGLPLDHRSDIYSLGVTLFRMLAGSLPFSGESAIGVIYMHVNLPAPDLRDARPDLPPEIARLLGRMLEKQPMRRPPSAEVLAGELDALATDLESRSKKRA